MNREILFRGRMADGEWRQGLLYQNFDKTYAIRRNSINYNVETDTIGQYIGLTDKNGKKIFEGDILKCGNRTVYIDWDGEKATAWKINAEYELIKYIALSVLSADGEVIGNIYDNKDLLEEDGK